MDVRQRLRSPEHTRRLDDPLAPDVVWLLAGTAVLGHLVALWVGSHDAAMVAYGLRDLWTHEVVAVVAGLLTVVPALVTVAAARAASTPLAEVAPGPDGRPHLPARPQVRARTLAAVVPTGGGRLGRGLVTDPRQATEALRQGLDDAQVRLVFEPLVIPSTDTVAGAEVRLRWDAPAGATLEHEAVLEAAAHADSSTELGVWMVEQAIAERSRWPTGMFVAVDVPGGLVADPTPLVRAVTGACRRFGVRPEDVWLEFDERVVADVPLAGASLQAVAATGARIVLDRFGACNASLIQLRELPVDACKLDPSLVDALLDPAGMFVVKAVRTVVHAYDMEVVAAGVATPDQRLLLDDLGFDLLQGDGAHGPLTAPEFRALLAVVPDVPAEPPAPTPADPVHATTSAQQQRVLYYRDERVLAEWVADAFAAGLAAGHPVVAIADATRLHAVTECLLERGVDVLAELRAGRLVEVEARTVLDRLLTTDTVPDAIAFEELLDDLLSIPGRPWVYSELTAQLWERGDVAATMAMEALWERALERDPFLLLRSHRTYETISDGATDAVEW
ncbi:EAL domain-containing protein [Egicoccus sp. AB-alg2]|uniref:EAL domain-containing protein n=1 Tax=Egicoccus sp. AB-alg2 TaxID=3242693 RepID=UPI00359D0813